MYCNISGINVRFNSLPWSIWEQELKIGRMKLFYYPNRYREKLFMYFIVRKTLPVFKCLMCLGEGLWFVKSRVFLSSDFRSLSQMIIDQWLGGSFICVYLFWSYRDGLIICSEFLMEVSLIPRYGLLSFMFSLLKWCICFKFGIGFQAGKHFR